MLGSTVPPWRTTIFGGGQSVAADVEDASFDWGVAVTLDPFALVEPPACPNEFEASQGAVDGFFLGARFLAEVVFDEDVP